MRSTTDRRRRAAAGAVTLATLLALVLIAARLLDPVPEGLRAQYFSNTEWRGEPALSVIDAEPSSEHLFIDWTGTTPESFSTSWSGALVAPRGGSYTFATTSDQGSWVYIDERLVVDNDGRRGSPLARGTIALQRGVHSIVIRYRHLPGAAKFTFLWARADAALEPVPAWAMRPRQISYARFLTDRALDAAATAAGFGWIVTLLWAATIAFGPEMSRLRSQIAGDQAWPALAWILAASAALNIIGLWWGLPSGGWVGDELGPQDILDALSRHFAHGWWSKYPPLHYYVLALADTPMLALDRLGLVGIHTTLGYTLLMVTGRAVSVVMSAATLVAMFLCGRRAFGWRAGLFAAAVWALAAPIVFYSKTANVDVPYLMWLAFSLVFFLRVLDGGSVVDYVCWSAAAAFAICTKDQAYAFCLLMPVIVLHAMWRANRQARLSHSLWRAVTDRRIGAAAVTALVLFVLCHNLVFNAAGFMVHVRWITGRPSEYYRAFEPTVRGRLSLLGLTLQLIERSWGWPLCVVSAAGMIAALATARHRRIAICLLVPMASYYFGFINVVLYNYDRFVLPMCLVLAPFGGFALDRFTARPAPSRTWRLAGVGALFAYSLLYSGTVDALMVNDSRYAVERWLVPHVGRDDLVGMSGLPRNLPRLEGFNLVDITSLEMLSTAQPAFFVLNADYTRTEPADSPLGQVIGALRGGRANYSLVLRVRSRSPWPWLPLGHPDLVGDRLEPDVLSVLRNINPTIEVFERNRSR
jgi:hypothetical protein